MGAAIVTIGSGEGYTVMGNRRVTFGQLTLSSSYATGGDTLTAQQVGLQHFTCLDFVSSVNSGTEQDGFSFSATIPAAAQTATIQAFGDGGNSPGGPLIEAAAGVNLTGYSVQFIAYGF